MVVQTRCACAPCIPLQQKAIYSKFMESLLQKSSKLRSLVKDLKKNYAKDCAASAPQGLKL